MDRHGLNRWSFGFNRRHRQLGVCYHKYHMIELSEHFVENNSDALVTDIIKHEIAHALVAPNHGHDIVWRQKALEIGATPQALCYTSISHFLYRAMCKNCGQYFYRFRQVYGLARGHFNYCTNCGEEKGRLTFVRGHYYV